MKRAGESTLSSGRCQAYFKKKLPLEIGIKGRVKFLTTFFFSPKRLGILGDRRNINNGIKAAKFEYV